MSCMCETKCFTTTWKIENLSRFSSTEESIISPVWKTETTEDYAWWRLLLYSTNLDLEFSLTTFKGKMKEKDCKYEMSVLTSSGEIKLRNEISNNFRNYCCSYKIEKNKIFGETSDSIFHQATLTLCCRIWMQKLKPERRFFRTALHEVYFNWVIEGFSLNSDSIQRSLHEQEKNLLTTFVYKYTTEASTHRVRIELTDYGKGSTFVSCHIYISDGSGQVISTRHIFPRVGWEWDVAIHPEECPDGNLHLEFKSLVAVDVELRKPLDSEGLGSSNTLSRDLLQLYKKKALCDVTLNTEDASLSAHKNVLASRSRVFEAMFERDQTVEGRSGVVEIDDVDGETMDRLLVYLYSDSLEEDLRWEQASELYYAADKYTVLSLKRECAQVLMVGLTSDNVCDALVLADRHSDEQLMSCAVDFVRYNEEVIDSSAWENLEKSNALLTVKVLRQIIQQKDKK